MWLSYHEYWQPWLVSTVLHSKLKSVIAFKYSDQFFKNVLTNFHRSLVSLTEFAAPIIYCPICLQRPLRAKAANLRTCGVFVFSSVPVLRAWQCFHPPNSWMMGSNSTKNSQSFHIPVPMIQSSSWSSSWGGNHLFLRLSRRAVPVFHS